ncbi:hypothetical protein HYFRA_00009374 [Hymenoscyphus fraxineus]|uniref:Uncharacterized protein n=1 Tax=Hymenoscyphus fraxineus TaxID=746836 RepID=A0A9N9PVX5_9HELO|nr:hypothetical protein HYFRA_00009374 [Hymenoscyphus fraxineus]
MLCRFYLTVWALFIAYVFFFVGVITSCSFDDDGPSSSNATIVNSSMAFFPRSVNAPTMTIIATVSEVERTLCIPKSDMFLVANSMTQFHCVTTSVPVTSTITSPTASTTTISPKPTTTKSAGAYSAKDSYSGTAYVVVSSLGVAISGMLFGGSVCLFVFLIFSEV